MSEARNNVPTASPTSSATVQLTRPYSEEEISRLREIIRWVKNDESNQRMTHWGNYHDYTRGW